MSYAIISLLLILAYVVFSYNHFIKKRNKLKEAYATMDVMLKKRYDLIPNLVKTVNQYMIHEKTLLEEITKLRQEAMVCSGKIREAKEDALSERLSTLIARFESYPELKASDNMLHLQRTLVKTEEYIGASRRNYNSTVRLYNTAIQVFPANMLASLFGFTKAGYFEALEEEKNNVELSFRKDE
ncbi:LemA family protein [Heliorestis acidaminivorans]|uniref:LemA family protein n=1 Tax=Heliorestis acidaminivorans TaxID=553427 RepID=A0A6I0ESE6_9FIRM|nr:LemA family protein [Heliorestis acidaminivorans]KAB2953430.1 LemA family protein [Heliorestis acidaminivorans]